MVRPCGAGPLIRLRPVKLIVARRNYTCSTSKTFRLLRCCGVSSSGSNGGYQRSRIRAVSPHSTHIGDPWRQLSFVPQPDSCSAAKLGRFDRAICHWATRRKRFAVITHQSEIERSCGAFNPHIDLAAECPEVD